MKSSNKNRVLITGGAGFIGSHLSEYLINQKNTDVAILDNLTTGSLGNLPKKTHDKINFIEGDVKNENIIEKEIKKSDIIYHLAASVGVKNILNNPLETLHTNVNGTENILKYGTKYNSDIFIASTSEVYGKSNEIPLKESQDRLLGSTQKERWGYSCSKAFDEFLAQAYHKEKGVRVWIGRFFNVIGPRQTGNYGMVVPTFVNQALNNKPITVYGDGKQVRTFAYVKEVIEAMDKITDTESLLGTPVNIGGKAPITILELAQKVRKLTNKDVEIKHIPYEQAYGEGYEDIQKRVPDTTKLKKNVNFTPTRSIDSMLKEVISFFD